jgi:hypothetical protein
MPNSGGSTLGTTKLTRHCSVINNFLFDIYLIREALYSKERVLRKRLAVRIQEAERLTALAKLVLPRDDRVVPPTAAFDEAIEIFGIDIAAQFPVALFGSKLPKHFPESRNCEHRESAFD